MSSGDLPNSPYKAGQQVTVGPVTYTATGVTPGQSISLLPTISQPPSPSSQIPGTSAPGVPLEVPQEPSQQAASLTQECDSIVNGVLSTIMNKIADLVIDSGSAVNKAEQKIRHNITRQVNTQTDKLWQAVAKISQQVQQQTNTAYELWREVASTIPTPMQSPLVKQFLKEPPFQPPIQGPLPVTKRRRTPYQQFEIGQPQSGTTASGDSGTQIYQPPSGTPFVPQAPGVGGGIPSGGAPRAGVAGSSSSEPQQGQPPPVSEQEGTLDEQQVQAPISTTIQGGGGTTVVNLTCPPPVVSVVVQPSVQETEVPPEITITGPTLTQEQQQRVVERQQQAHQLISSKCCDRVVEQHTPLSLLFGPFDLDWFQAADAFVGNTLSELQSFATVGAATLAREAADLTDLEQQALDAINRLLSAPQPAPLDISEWEVESTFAALGAPDVSLSAISDGR